MQRIFSTFPSGWPGAGLFVLRVAASTPLLMDGVTRLSDGTIDITLLLGLWSCLAGLLMLVGFLTPISALFQAIVENLRAFTGSTLHADHLIQASIGISLLMLGPGGWSIDARLYGRKRIDLGR